MTPSEIQTVLERAKIPEHSIPLMAAISGGSPFIEDSYLFFAADDWLIALGWPLQGQYGDQGFSSAMDKAMARSGARVVYAAGPEMPASWKDNVTETDRFYVLSARASVPGRLKNAVLKAQNSLDISEGSEFTPEHRRLWAEAMETKRAEGNISPRVLELYAKTPQALAAGNLRFLNAWRKDGRLAAALLLDYNPANFCAYIIGAHSRLNYVPHATDALFAAMLVNAGKAGKRYIHLGLGATPGILRFKLKWGAIPASAYTAAQWEVREKNRQTGESIGRTLALAMLAPQTGSARRLIADSPSRKPYAMLWRLEKKGRVSWLGGTAHFFCHSFEPSFRSLFAKVENVLFEGPLDAGFMAQVQENGASLPAGASPLLAKLTEDEIRNLEKAIKGKSLLWSRELAPKPGRSIDVRELLRASRPWHAFFTLWTAFLEKMGWHQSVDMEAWTLAHECGKKVIAMENLEEQLESLNSLPEERVLRFFRDCGSWPRRAKNNERAYLAGDLERMMGTSAEFPTRTEHIVSRRDQRFRERMLPWLARGNAAVFVGTAHLVNLRGMLAEDGFKVEQRPFGILPKIRLAARKRKYADKDITW